MIALLAAAAVATQLGQGPVEFTAESLRMEPRERRAILDGQVELRRDDLLLTCDHAVGDLQEEQKPLPKKQVRRKAAAATPAISQAVRRFDVQGKVHFVRGTRTADADHGVLDNETQTLVLTGTATQPPVLRDGTETLSGDRIVMKLDSEDVEVQKPRIVLRRSMDSEKPSPVKVEASQLFLDRQRNLARFTDDVVVRRGDTIARSPRMDARYDDDGQLRQLEMRGGVDVRQGDRRATGENADYDARRRTVVLTGAPKLYDRGDVLLGDRIDMALDSHEVHVERAQGRFHPEAHRDEPAPAREVTR